MIYRRGIVRFDREARGAGVDGILIADMPVEESDDVTRTAIQYGSIPSSLSHKRQRMRGLTGL